VLSLRRPFNSHPPGHRETFRLAALTILLVGSLCAPAGAQDFAPEESPAVDQYLDPLPSAGGGRVPGVDRGGKGRPGRLDPALRAQLSGSPEGPVLERISTDPAFGAPGGDEGADQSGGGPQGADARGSGPASGGDAPRDGDARPDEQSAPSVVADTLSDGDSPVAPILAVVLLIAAAGGFAAVMRHRRRLRRQP
jgi:hypothetical protein